MTESNGKSRAWSDFCARLFSQNQFAIKLGLEPMQRALEQLGSPQHSHRAVLVAGTNGKGSTASALSAVLAASGCRVGLYTSPHLVDFTERFRINGAPVDQSDVLRVGASIYEQFGRAEASPRLTFFELTTLIAVVLFDELDVDVAIYEVGLGGRLDATNALSPDLSIITTLGFDHQAYLGDTIESIAYEKSGIMRAGRPVVIGPQEHDGALDALIEQTNIYRVGEVVQFGREVGVSQHETSTCTWHGVDMDQRVDVTSAPTSQMQRHWAVAIESARLMCELLERRSPSAEDISSALGSLRWYGRFDIHRPDDSIELLTDAAHNPDGVRVLVEQMHRRGWMPDVVVVGAMKDKDLHGLFGVLSQWSAPVIGVLIDNPRAASASQLEQVISSDRLLGAMPLDEAWSTVTRWCQTQRAHEKARVLVFGSLYLLGELYQHLSIDVGRIHDAP